jgi:hypothetical protein
MVLYRYHEAYWLTFPVYIAAIGAMTIFGWQGWLWLSAGIRDGTLILLVMAALFLGGALIVAINLLTQIRAIYIHSDNTIEFRGLLRRIIINAHDVAAVRTTWGMHRRITIFTTKGNIQLGYLGRGGPEIASIARFDDFLTHLLELNPEVEFNSIP